jgi:starch phosphorylase
MERYFKKWAEECGIVLDRLMELGHFPGEPADAPFNMAVMGLRLAGMSNGVSKLHGEVSRKMFQPLWPGVPAEEVPIGSITNGVHARTWVSLEMNDLLTRYVLPGWDGAGAEDWERIADARDDELWRVREQGREALIAFVRARLKQSLAAQGVSEVDAAWADEALDSRVLTIGFARRFAAYKRATLMLSEPDRLRRLLLSADRPVQLVFAGKAHPADDLGKEMIRQLVQFSRDPTVRHRIAFIEDYDISVARTLYQGSDVWLNTPRRPMEACGTSGEKAALSGALNFSILDGWWDEMFDGTNGWAISSAESYDDLTHRDQVEADSLFEVLERQIVPLFYDRTEGRVPRRWVRRVKSSLRTLGPRVVATRMVRDYVEQMYEPIALRADALAEAGHARGRALARWKQRIATAWPQVRVARVDTEDRGVVADLGATRHVSVVVALGPLAGDDVAVELLHGPVGPNDELADTSLVTLPLAGLGDEPGQYMFTGQFVCERAGRYGLAVRVVPAHDDLLVAAETGCVTWA